MCEHRNCPSLYTGYKGLGTRAGAIPKSSLLWFVSHEGGVLRTALRSASLLSCVLIEACSHIIAKPVQLTKQGITNILV